MKPFDVTTKTRKICQQRSSIHPAPIQTIVDTREILGRYYDPAVIHRILAHLGLPGDGTAQNLRSRTPLRRLAEANDQARVICFLASHDADFVTGVTIDVTGEL
jgi:NAD(P)-dependent dehydrogenase (short-subunit alcohol dehydrogenase family)